VQFSIEGEQELSTPKNVNDVFYAGRSVNRLPVVIGYNRSNLHEETGAGIPFLLSSHEDEYTNNRNNIQDAAAQKLMRRWRVSKGADVNIDDLLNRPVAYYDADDATPIMDTSDIMPSMRTADQQSADINSLVPVDLSNQGRSVAPKGMNATLGTVQMGAADSTMKRNNMLQLRNCISLRNLPLHMRRMKLSPDLPLRKPTCNLRSQRVWLILKSWIFLLTYQ
jgi:hypothetical protein